MLVLNQPHEGTLGQLLIEHLQGEYESFTIVSAYAKMSGVQRLQPYIENFKSNGGSVRAFIGIDQRNTSYEALVQLQQLCNELYVVHSENLSHTFHQKIYIFQNDNNAWVSIGSNNLTSGGLWTNYETCMFFRYDYTIPEHYTEFNKLIELLNRYASVDYQCSIKITSVADIDRLFEERYIVRETQLTSGLINSANSNTGELRNRLFGTESFRAPSLPANVTQANIVTYEVPGNTHQGTEKDTSALETSVPYVQTIPETPAIQTAAGERFWFEMRASTGGSRNILDLSMVGRIVSGSAAGTHYEMPDPDQMLGGVAFFDIDPNNHNITRDITINFEGIDYYPSTILFAPNNGSWRLQLKGDNPQTEIALSEYGRTRFVNNILVFEKIRSDYYILRVVDGNYIDNVIASSRVHARNGLSSTSKMYGMID